MTTKKEMIKIVYDYVKENEIATFDDIEELFKENDYQYSDRNCALYHGGYDTSYNIYIWSGWNADACDVWHEVLKMGVEGIPTSLQTLLILGGRVLDIPIAKSARQYKKPHWCPMYMKYTGVPYVGAK